MEDTKRGDLCEVSHPIRFPPFVEYDGMQRPAMSQAKCLTGARFASRHAEVEMPAPDGDACYARIKASFVTFWWHHQKFIHHEHFSWHSSE
jgi:hypothetical protein